MPKFTSSSAHTWLAVKIAAVAVVAIVSVVGCCAAVAVAVTSLLRCCFFAVTLSSVACVDGNITGSGDRSCSDQNINQVQKYPIHEDITGTLLTNH